MRSHKSIRREGSAIRGEANGAWANGVGVGGLMGVWVGGGGSVVLINVKGTAGHTHKVNGGGGERVRRRDQAAVNICLAG